MKQSIKPMVRAFKQSQKDGLQLYDFFIIMSMSEEGEMSSDDVDQILSFCRVHTMTRLRSLIKEGFLVMTRKQYRKDRKIQPLRFYELTKSGHKVADSWRKAGKAVA